MEIRALFLDVGGVLLTNGWDTALRRKMIDHFQLDGELVDQRHRLVFDTFETGRMTLDEYLRWTIFFEPRTFTIEEFKEMMLGAARPFTPMINLVRQLKEQFGLQTIVISNEGRELAEDRYERFSFREFIDCYVVSSFVQCKKPCFEIYQYGLDFGQLSPEEVIYIDDRPLLAGIAQSYGFHTIAHKDAESTKAFCLQLLS